MPRIVDVEIVGIDNLDVRTKVARDKEGGARMVTVVKFECNLSPVRIAKIVELMREDVPCYAIIGSKQAMFDPFRDDGPLGEPTSDRKGDGSVPEEAEPIESLGLADELLQEEIIKEEAVEQTSK